MNTGHRGGDQPDMRVIAAGLVMFTACSGHGSGQGPSTGQDPDAAAGADIDAGRDDGTTAIVFDNPDGAFEWTPTRYAPCCGTEPGLHLDLTMAAGSQSGDPAPSAVEFFISWDEANTTPGGFFFRSSGDPATPEGLRIADGEPVVLEGGAIETYTIHPPLAMNAGDTIGPDLTWRSTEHEWEDGASGPQTVHLADPGGDYPPDHAAFTAGIIGVELPLADGIHYGFVDVGWQDAASVSDGRHLAVRWGYEPAPDTPLVIPP